MRGWRNGSRASLRNWWSNPWRFESSPAHMLNEASQAIARDIWKAIMAAKNILLHCHPSPDGDSIGSTLAMYHALKNIGKEVTAIWGDSNPAQQFSFLPGFDQIVRKNYFEIGPEQFDLFIIQDSAAIDRVSMKGEVIFPSSMRTVIIDHHVSNPKFAEINLVPDNVPATAAVLYELFLLWKIEMTKEIAACLMIGLYTDTGGFRFRGVTSRIFEIMTHLTGIEPRFPDLIASMENDIDFGKVAFLGLAYNNIQFACNNRAAISVVSNDMLKEKKIDSEDTQKQPIANMLRSLRGVNIGIECVEVEPNKVKFSFRSRDPEKYDVAKLAAELGGGGHKVAAGVLVPLPLEEAKKKVLEKMAELYPDLA